CCYASSITLLFSVARHTSRATRFPYTTRFRSRKQIKPLGNARRFTPRSAVPAPRPPIVRADFLTHVAPGDPVAHRGVQRRVDRRDRKSTRLNSRHVKNSYAVLCLKKKRTVESA